MCEALEKLRVTWALTGVGDAGSLGATEETVNDHVLGRELQ